MAKDIETNTEPAHVAAARAEGNRLLIVAMLAVVGVFALFTGLLWKIGLLSFSGTEASAKVIAAAISLVGGLMAALMTLLGLVLKQSIDLRSIALQEQTEARVRLESERNSRLAEDAERRLKAEAAIKAVGLLGTSTGQEVADTQRAGVILALGDLDKMALALALVEQLLPAGKLDGGTVCWLISKALTSPEVDISSQAALLINYHVDKLLLPGGDVVFPAPMVREDYFSFSRDVRLSSSWAIIDLLMLRPFSQWQPGIFFVLLDHLYSIWKRDEDEGIKTNAATALARFIGAYAPNQEVNFNAGSKKASELTEELAEYAQLELDGTMLTSGKLRSVSMAEWVQALKSDGMKATEEHGATPKPVSPAPNETAGP